VQIYTKFLNYMLTDLFFRH